MITKMKTIKDLIGHTILDVNMEVDCVIKTDKGFYKLLYQTFPDGTMSDIEIAELKEFDWRSDWK